MRRVVKNVINMLQNTDKEKNGRIKIKHFYETFYNFNFHLLHYIMLQVKVC